MVDYIVVGAGSAGCVLANRLTENRDISVLLLEAGGPDSHPEIHIPARWLDLLGTEFDWSYKTEPQQHLNGRVLDCNRGKVLGGSSSINAMIYIRGHRWDYDHWAELGNQGWSYEDVLPYFKKAEHQERGPSEYHGINGPLNVADLAFVSPLSDLFIKAGLDRGWSANPDFNGATQEGVGQYQFTSKNGERHSAADAYLRPALDRSNLSSATHAYIRRILFEGNQATGVEYVHNNETKTAYADCEIILCAGAINSPQILLCSGIGPADHLELFDISVVVDLPGVGQNLQDHPAVLLAYITDPLWRVDFSLAGPDYEEYLLSKTGKLAANRTAVGAFVKTRPELKAPNIEFATYDAAIGGDIDFGISYYVLRPGSRGSVRLRSANPFDHPIIQPNYLQDEEDLKTLVDGVKLTRDLIQTQPFQSIRKTEVSPGNLVQSHAGIAEWVRNTMFSVWHCCGTCKMGDDAMAVVDAQLRVHGVERLRIVDASIMPDIVGGNTNAPTIMIAEKAADMIKGEAP
jgi:choline dehydrogenase